MTAVAHSAGRASRFGMGWVTWRQHRAALAGACGALGVMIGYMLVTGLQMRSALSSLGLDTCHPPTTAWCATAVGLFNNDYDIWRNDGLVVMQAVPLFVGVFTGAPLLARELETGTFRFAWTQGTPRTRWVIAKLALVAVVVTAAAGATSLMLYWWVAPFAARGWSLMAPNVFQLTGVAFPAWTLAAFALGAFAGMAIRRTVPALAAAMAVWAGLAIATATSLRWRYQAAIVVTRARPSAPQAPARAWTQLQWFGPGGQPVSTGAVRHLLDTGAGQHVNPVSLLLRHGYRLSVSYQPEGRFWHFQLIEGGWLLALSLLLGAATVWLARHRAA
jgi:hypothetical protein